MPNFFRCSICRELVVEWGQIAGCARCLAARQPEPQPGTTSWTCRLPGGITLPHAEQEWWDSLFPRPNPAEPEFVTTEAERRMAVIDAEIILRDHAQRSQP